MTALREIAQRIKAAGYNKAEITWVVMAEKAVGQKFYGDQNGSRTTLDETKYKKLKSFLKKTKANLVKRTATNVRTDGSWYNTKYHLKGSFWCVFVFISKMKDGNYEVLTSLVKIKEEVVNTYPPEFAI